MKLSQSDIIIRYLQDTGRWHATYELRSIKTRYGDIGSAGEVRARELARNDCAERRKNLVEREDGKNIGLRPGIEYFRFKEAKPQERDYQSKLRL